jgi:hypothetical protein
MMVATFFESVKDLEQITGLTRGLLWLNGFNLDDMDFGIVCNKEIVGEWCVNPFYESWLLDSMDRHGVGYHHTEYDGRHYYTVHHS